MLDYILAMTKSTTTDKVDCIILSHTLKPVMGENCFKYLLDTPFGKSSQNVIEQLTRESEITLY